MKKITNKIHLILGLGSGLVVFIVAITGCLWVFKEEIKAITQEELNIENSNDDFLSITEAETIAHTVYPDKLIHGILYDDTSQPIEAIFYQAEPLFYSSVFIHPTQGDILKTENHLTGFFAFILDGHLHLWLPEAIGTQIVKWSTVLFFVLVLSGIYLWWPRNKKNRKQRFKFDWKSTTKWKRKNFDLHSIIGFYSCLFALLFIITGLIMAFPLVNEGVYKAMGGDKKATFLIPDGSTLKKDNDNKPIDLLLSKLEKEYPSARDFEIHLPYTDSASIYVEISNQDGVFYNSDFVFYDQNTLEEIPTPTYYGKYDMASLPDKIIRMNYDTHIGAIAGLPGKILAFLASLTVASLPVTGFLLWFGRKFKKKRNKAKTKDIRSLASVS
jgi:uncharacterized iron-regulated membrane protein